MSNLSLETSIIAAQRRLTSRFILLGVGLMALVTSGSVALTVMNAREVAAALSNSYRNQLLLGQYREATQGLGANVPAIFSSIRYNDRDSRLVFRLPSNEEIQGRVWSEIVFSHDLTISDSDASSAGVIRYGVSIHRQLFWSFFFSLIVGAAGYPLLRRSLRQARDQMIRAAQQQRREEFSTLARQIAHDIRSPLSAITVAAHAVKASNPKASSMMVAASERIQKMANQLLDYSRAPDASVSPVSTAAKPRPGFEVLEVIQRILNEYEEKPGALLRTNFASRLEGQFIFEPDGLGRIISNLLNNAFEAVALVERTGEINIAVTAENEELRISISDNGPGIDPVHIESILQGQSIGKVMGNGLGVSSARQRLESWGGSLEIQSRKDGASLVLTLRN